jgi:Ca2+-binding EF-hand superfamily protein
MGFFFKDERDKRLVLSLLDSDGSGTISFIEFQIWWKSNKDSFFVPTYSQGVKSAIYYFKKYDVDMSGALDISEFKAVRALLCCQAFCSPDRHWRWADVQGDELGRQRC